MSFVNELMSQENIEKYEIEKIDRDANKGHFASEWTVDKERDIYLRWMMPDNHAQGRNYFTFYWKGVLMSIALKRNGDGIPGGKGYTKWSFWEYQGKSQLHLPENLEKNREQIISDLKEALVAFKDFGTLSKVSDHTAFFEF